MHYTNLLQSMQDRRYTGAAADFEGAGQGPPAGASQLHPCTKKGDSTRPTRPLRLRYYEACLSEGDAKRRERYLQTGKGKRYPRQRLTENSPK